MKSEYGNNSKEIVIAFCCMIEKILHPSRNQAAKTKDCEEFLVYLNSFNGRYVPSCQLEDLDDNHKWHFVSIIDNV